MQPKRIGITPSQVVNAAAIGSAVMLSFLHQNSITVPPWVLWIMAGLAAVAGGCRSYLSANNGGVNDPKAAAVHSGDGAP